ncbi:unnamed protein product [Trichogramma brassicae]|uniref:Protein sidekick n=1 Tax=Trichogramma brassicae TaxID=86971 RepID=A0A6H5IXI3_9HYME|nr:unnamed protein product [Trichogramma brassicae]
MSEDPESSVKRRWPCGPAALVAAIVLLLALSSSASASVRAGLGFSAAKTMKKSLCRVLYTKEGETFLGAFVRSGARRRRFHRKTCGAVARLFSKAPSLTTLCPYTRERKRVQLNAPGCIDFVLRDYFIKYRLKELSHATATSAEITSEAHELKHATSSLARVVANQVLYRSPQAVPFLHRFFCSATKCYCNMYNSNACTSTARIYSCSTESQLVRGCAAHEKTTMTGSSGRLTADDYAVEEQQQSQLALWPKVVPSRCTPSLPRVYPCQIILIVLLIINRDVGTRFSSLCIYTISVTEQRRTRLKALETLQEPRFSMQPSSSGGLLSENRTKIFQCQAGGNPQPKYRWFKDGQPLTSELTSEYFYRLHNTRRDDSGIYYCVATNQVGSIFSERISFSVVYMGEFEDLSERIVKVQSGDAAVLEMPKIESHPAPDVIWTTSDGTIPYIIKYATVNQKLIILNAVAHDEGHYRARAHNTQLGKEVNGPFFRLEVTGDSNSEVAPSIVVKPEDTKIIKDQGSAYLHCIANARNLHELQTIWTKDDIPIEDARITFNFKDSWNRTLILISANLTYSGVYACHVDLKTGGYPTISASANVEVLEKPTFRTELKRVTLSEYGKTVSLHCDAEGVPPPTIQWFRNAEPIQRLPGSRYSMQEDGSLVIKKLKMEDSGMFQCLALNDAGEASSYTWLKAKTSVPIMEVIPKNVTVLDGKDAILPCRAIAAPAPNVTWFYNDKTPLEIAGRVQVLESGDLVIGNTKRSDAGKYTCVRANEAGSTNASAHISVIVRTQIVQPPVDQSVLLGNTAELKCEVSNDPSVNYDIAWFHNNQVINPSQRVKMHRDGSLEIGAVRASDVGNYTCSIVSSGGNETRTARLSVIELPFAPVSVVASRVEHLSPRSINVTWVPGFDGNSLIKSYIVQRREVPELGPLPDVSLNWITEFSNISANARWVLFDNLKAAAVYQFRVSAENSVGEGPSSEPSNVVVLPQEPPSGPPVGFVGSARSSSEIITQWQPPSEEHRNGHILGYVLRYKLHGYNEAPWMIQNITNEAQKNFLITDLITWKDYIVQIAAYNDKGVGVFTNELRIKTKEGVPEAPPTDVRVKAINSTAVMVWWRPPNPQKINGINQGYKLQAWHGGFSENDEYKTITVAPNLFDPQAEHSAVMNHLKKYTLYNITVLCFTNPGDGERSDPVPVRTSEDGPQDGSPMPPSELSIIRTLSSVELQWTNGATGKAPLLGYYIETKSKEEAQKTLEESMAMDIEDRHESDLELYRSRQGAIASISNGTLGKRSTLSRKPMHPPPPAVYGKSPPRPSPASVAYHSDEESLKGYDENPDDSSVTEKPSEISSTDSQLRPFSVAECISNTMELLTSERRPRLKQSHSYYCTRSPHTQHVRKGQAAGSSPQNCLLHVLLHLKKVMKILAVLDVVLEIVNLKKWLRTSTLKKLVILVQHIREEDTMHMLIIMTLNTIMDQILVMNLATRVTLMMTLYFKAKMNHLILWRNQIHQVTVTFHSQVLAITVILPKGLFWLNQDHLVQNLCGFKIDQVGLKILAVDPPTYDYLIKEYQPADIVDSADKVESSKVKPEETSGSDVSASVASEVNTENQKDEKSNEDEDKRSKTEDGQKSDSKAETPIPKQESKAGPAYLAGMKIQQVVKPITESEEIDITKALTTSGRAFYPKVAKKTRIDEFLARRTHLKLLEERRLSQSEKAREIINQTAMKKTVEENDVDGEKLEENSVKSKTLLPAKVINKAISPGTRDVLAAIGKRIQQVKTQYTNLTRLGGKNMACYSKYCNQANQNLKNKTLLSAQTLTPQCYSPTCLKMNQLKRDLLILLRKANALNNKTVPLNSSITTTKPISSPIASVKISDKQQSEIKNEFKSANENEIKTEVKLDEKNDIKNEVKSETETEIKNESNDQINDELSNAKKLTNESLDDKEKLSISASETDKPAEKKMKLDMANPSVWPYPCPRPLFKTCWLYRTVGLRSLAAAALQLRILWSCIRWDDVNTKPMSSDGKHQITTDTEIMSLEILKHRHVGQFMDKTQYLRRKVVIPLELPKQVREVTSIRSGLRKRKRPESPQSTEPQVSEEWVDEDKLELWEIKQYGERVEKANAQIMTRSRSGGPQTMVIGNKGNSSFSSSDHLVSGKATPEEIKEKMEQQLRQQRAAHQQKRALENLKNLGTPGTPGTPVTQLVKVTSNSIQVTTPPVTPHVPQKVQILRGPDGKLQVRGLLPGQQLVQMPDGKLHVLNTAQTASLTGQQSTPTSVATTPTPNQLTVKKPVSTIKLHTTPGKTTPLTAQSSQIQSDTATTSQQNPAQLQQVIQASQRLKAAVVNSGNVTTPVTQQKFVIANTGQVVQGTQVLSSPGQVITGAVNQIVVNSPVLAQQLASGKAQLATINGQQVILRTNATGGNLVQLSPGNIIMRNAVTPTKTVAAQQVTTQTTVSNENPTSSISESTTTTVVNSPTTTTTQATQAPPSTPTATPGNVEASLLQGQPPGTVIKCVTAQVIQTTQGPRIVLQGIQNANFTPAQLSMVHHQVKQQLLKAQESAGNKSVIGPTKIYLAVQPAPSTTKPQQIQSPAQNDLAPKSKIVTTDSVEEKVKTEPSEVSKPEVASPNKTKTVQQDEVQKLNVANGQQPVQTPKDSAANAFVVTPDYIQQTIKNALKQENLNPEIEEKLLQLQRYQEKQMKGSDGTTVSAQSHITPLPTISRAPARKRPTPSQNSTTPTASQVSGNEKTEWSTETPKRRPPPKQEHREITKKQQEQSRMQVLLFRHKELLKKDILKRRALLEKELSIDVQKDLSSEIANRTKAERHKQEEVKVGSAKRKANAQPPQLISPPNKNRPKKQKTGHNLPTSNTPSSRMKKEKLYCLCRTPYDETKFYVGCDLCNNWFHGDCVGITEEMSKTMSEFVCTECRHARDTQELYCLCKQPYDESQFYICCDKCQDWFHGRCVGILQSEADNIDEYVCPNCQRNSSVNFANMKNLNIKDVELLKKLIKQIQTHKSAWPFMEPVDPNEAPDYYKVIKEPMDLQTIELRINEGVYKKLSEFIGDMTKIFDNCRYYNPKESPFFKCAESLETYFVNKIKCLREKFSEAK